MTEHNISEIDVDLDHDLIKQILTASVVGTMSEASASIIHQVMAIDDVPLNEVYEAVGRAIFNEILINILEEEMRTTQETPDAE